MHLLSNHTQTEYLGTLVNGEYVPCTEYLPGSLWRGQSSRPLLGQDLPSLNINSSQLHLHGFNDCLCGRLQ